MKMSRKWILVAALVLSVAMASSGTIAYLQDSDSDVNVMTMGSVYIEQIEQERVNDTDNQQDLQGFQQDKPLLPAVFEGSSIPWAPEDEWVVPGDQAWKVVEDNVNVVDKFVTVKNIGKTAAFVRTIIAYEGDAEYGPEGAYIHVVHNTDNVDPAIDCVLLGHVEINGVYYTVYVYTYPEALAAGDETIPSLKQIYMNKAADNDIVAHYGETYDVLVLSQAVQADGFEAVKDATGAVVKTAAQVALDTAFGEITATNHPWLVKVSNGASLQDAINNANAGAEIALEENVDYGTITLSGDLNNITISGADGAQVKVDIAADANLNNVTLNNFDLDASKATYGTQFITIASGAKGNALKITNSTFTGAISQAVRTSSTTLPVAFENVTFDGQKYSYYASGAASGATFEDCTFQNMRSWAFQINNEAQSDLIMNNCTFDNCASGLVKCLYGIAADSEFVFTNNTVTNSQGHDGKESQWFWINATSAITAENNTLDGAEWVPGAAQGLGK